MKLLKTLTLGVLAATAIAGSASAQTVIHITGSTAFRNGTTIAIIDSLAGNTVSGGPGAVTSPKSVYEAYSSDGNIASANYMIFANGTVASPTVTSPTATVIVEASWTGSLAGVVDVVAGQSQAPFLNYLDNGTVANAINSGILNTSTYTGGTSVGAETALVGTSSLTTGTVEMAMSDADQGTVSTELATGTLSGSLGSYSSIKTLAAAVANANVLTNAGTSNYASGNGDVGIVPFEWVVGKITTSGYTLPTNITENSARALISNGYIAQGLLTGTNTAADSANYFYLVGRNEDSGTRIGAFSESQFGLAATDNPFQYIVGDDSSSFTGSWSVATAGGGTASGSGIALYPANAVLNTEKQISWGPSGHSGYATGGNVGSVLKIANPGTVTISTANGGAFNNTGASYFMGYLGLTDAGSAVSKGATALNYNGVTYSPAQVQNGNYTFWWYEHSYELKSLSGVTRTYVDNIADNIYNTDADIIDDSNAVISHAENTSTGVYTYTTGAVPEVSAGIFDDIYMNVSRLRTEGADPVVIHN